MKVKVPVIGTVNRSVSIEADAPSRAEVAALIQEAMQNITVSGGTPSVVTVIWRFIREVPLNIQRLAALATSGLITRKADGTIVTRSIAVADTARLTVTNAAGDAGNPTLDMADITARSAWVRSANTDGKPAPLQSSGNKAVLSQSGTALQFATIDSTFISDFTEAAQDAVGSTLTDTATIDLTYNDGAGTITASVIDASITYAKMQNVSAASKLLGSGASGAGASPAEITLGTNLSMSGTTLNATGGGGNFVFVGTSTVAGAAATTLASVTLDLNTDIEYQVRVKLNNATASIANISLFFNSDTTAGNYDTQLLTVNNATISSARANNAIVVALNASIGNTFTIRITRGADGVVASAISDMVRNPGSGIAFQNAAHSWRTLATNVTGLTISSSVASALAIGSSVKVWKLT